MLITDNPFKFYVHNEEKITWSWVAKQAFKGRPSLTNEAARRFVVTLQPAEEENK